ncbi:glycosyltransferase [Uliginosibacterium sp. sgz301328]|uniref:glycosyltransferase n=1 Tax=Uliginosibacterium sp. sgz301328 TaxID=3243764 RepID=UPI00359EE533
MKVLHVYRTYYPETQGGLQEAIRQICRGLTTCGVQSSVFTLAKNCEPARTMVDDSPVWRARSAVEIASCDMGSPVAMMAFRKAAREADVLNFHYPWPFGDLLATLANPGKPYVITYHSDIVRQRVVEPMYSPLRALFFRGASAIVATSPTYAMTSTFLARHREKIEIIPLCLDEQSLADPVSGAVARYVAQPDRPYFVFVGVLRYYKGLHFLIEAARQTGLQVVIAGDGPERDRLAAQAEGLGNVRFTGYIDDGDKAALLRSARAVVFPSHLRAEAFGVTLLEGGLCARPLISTEIGTGTSYVNLHGVTGLVVPPADPAALANAMTQLANDAELARRMGIAAQERCRDLFGIREAGARYARLYARTLGARLPARQTGGALEGRTRSINPTVDSSIK